uniref:Phosphoglycolate phosphatase n=1 Tax=Magnetococcus massalia (strain MO-1) TaxID=451514 RepID=A0A1S7LLI0_MAGMO|nr:Phosphoglycolate phosphatase [Candidatus Magnetococcus massalia]
MLKLESAKPPAAPAPLICRGILFDLDGTLVHTGPDLAGAMNHVLTKRGVDTLALEQVEHLVGSGARSLLARGFWGIEAEPPEYDADFEEAVEDFLLYYAEHIADTSHPYAGVMESLERFREQGMAMGVVTNKPAFLAKKLLQALGMDDYFRIVVGGDSLPTRKPQPEMLLHATVHMACAVDEVVMVGDSGNDIDAARNAGCPVVAVSYGYNRNQPIAELEPDRVVDQFTELNKLLVMEAG